MNIIKRIAKKIISKEIAEWEGEVKTYTDKLYKKIESLESNIKVKEKVIEDYKKVYRQLNEGDTSANPMIFWELAKDAEWRIEEKEDQNGIH